MIQTMLRLSPEEKANIEAIAEAKGCSQQAVMREAISTYLKKKSTQIAMGKRIIAARDELRGKD